MPCTYTGSFEGDARLAAQDAGKALSEVTQLLCTLCRHIEAEYADDIIGEVPEVSEWWEEHKEIDLMREKEELEQRLEEINEDLSEGDYDPEGLGQHDNH